MKIWPSTSSFNRARRVRLPWTWPTDHLRMTTVLAAILVGALGLISEASAAATGQPVVYALTPNNSVTVIDTGNHQVLRTVPLPGPARYLVGAPDGKHIYVTGTGLQEGLWVLETQSFTIVTFIQFDEEPSGLAISPDGTRVYATTQEQEDVNSEVYVVDTATNQLIANISDSQPYSNGIAISPDGKRVYVSLQGGHEEIGALDVIDTASNTIVADPHLGTGGINMFYWVAVSPDSSKVYTFASDLFGETGELATYVIDAATDKQTGQVNVTGQLSTPLPGSNILYGTNGGGVTVFSTQSNAVVKTIPVAATVGSLALRPDGKELYVSDSNTQSIAIVDTATNTVTGNVPVAGATGLAVIAAPPPFVSVPPVVNLQLSPMSVPPSSPATLTWTSSASTSCAASGEWSGSRDLQGSAQVSATGIGNHTYTLTCVGPGGTTAVSAQLTVIAGSTLSLSATDIPADGTVVVTWHAFSGATFCYLSAGKLQQQVAISGSLSVSVPASAGSGTVTLGCKGPPGNDEVSATYGVYTPGALAYSSLLLTDNLYAVAAPGTAPTNGGLDGHGYALDGPELLALPPDQSKLFGQAVTLGQAGKPSAVWGQAIPLGSAQLTQVSFIATAVNGDQLNQKFIVTYADGSTTTYSQSLSDWGTRSAYAGQDGYDPATSIEYDSPILVNDRITPTGTTQSHGWSLHKFRIPLDGTKVAVSLQLPKNRDVIVFAVNVTKFPQATAVPLSSAFNLTALATAGQASAGGRLDNHGYAFDASLIPNGFSALGQHFTLGTANQVDAVSKSTLSLPAASRLGLTVLATAVNAAQVDQAFLVTYQDGGTTLFKQSVSQWGAPQHYAGESIARTTATRITPAGTRQAGSWNLYAYTFQTDPNRKVVSLTLPNNRDVVVLAVNGLTP